MRAKAALVGLILVIAVFLGFTQSPGRTFALAEGPAPFGNGFSDELLVTTVIEHADNELLDDAFIEVDGFEVKQSNYHGVAFGGLVYYYCLAPHFCSCPVSRGTVDLNEVTQVYVDESSGFPIVVYTLDALTTSVIGISAPIAH
jgi:hypothetical protein